LADRWKGRGQTKRGTLVLQVWGLSVGLTLQPWKKILVTNTNGVKTGLMEGRRLGETRKRNFWRKNEFYLGTWNNWKVAALNPEGWRKLLKEAEAHPGLYRRWRESELQEMTGN